MSLDDEARMMMEIQYLEDISFTMPQDIAMLQRIKRKFPNLKDQAEACENLCREIILESKEAYIKLKQRG